MAWDSKRIQHKLTEAFKDAAAWKVKPLRESWYSRALFLTSSDGFDLSIQMGCTRPLNHLMTSLHGFDKEEMAKRNDFYKESINYIANVIGERHEENGVYKSVRKRPFTDKAPICTPEKETREEIKIRVSLDEERAYANHQTPEADQHSEYQIRTNREGKRRAYNTTGTVHDMLFKKGSISFDQHAAADQLFKDFTSARVILGFKSCLNITIGGGSRRAGDAIGMNYHAYEEFRLASEAICTKKGRKLTVAICCMQEWIKDVNNLNIPLHRRLDLLQRALDDLIRHYNNRINPGKAMKSYSASVQTTMG